MDEPKTVEQWLVEKMSEKAAADIEWQLFLSPGERHPWHKRFRFWLAYRWRDFKSRWPWLNEVD